MAHLYAVGWVGGSNFQTDFSGKRHMEFREAANFAARLVQKRLREQESPDVTVFSETPGGSAVEAAWIEPHTNVVKRDTMFDELGAEFSREVRYISAALRNALG